MKRYGYYLAILIVFSQLAGCVVSSAFTGAKLFYDRHNVYKKMRDHNIALKASNILAREPDYAKSSIDITVFNRDLLIAGQVPNQEFKDYAQKKLSQLIGVRRFFNQLRVGPNTSVGTKVNDALITAKIRAKIMANDKINPYAFKVVTENGTVYLMGDVQKEQATHVVSIARHVPGVKKVVRALRYFTYQSPSHIA